MNSIIFAFPVHCVKKQVPLAFSSAVQGVGEETTMRPWPSYRWNDNDKLYSDQKGQSFGKLHRGLIPGAHKGKVLEVAETFSEKAVGEIIWGAYNCS